MESDTEQLIQKLMPALKQHCYFALLFGSAAKNQLGPESDIDLGVYFKKRIDSLNEKLKVTNIFSKMFERNLDLISLNDADIIITNQILSTGKLIYNIDPGLFVQFKARKISEYIDFKRSRAPIEKVLLKKGWPKWKKKT